MVVKIRIFLNGVSADCTSLLSLRHTDLRFLMLQVLCCLLLFRLGFPFFKLLSPFLVILFCFSIFSFVYCNGLVC